MNPFELFDTWYRAESARSDARIPSACCLSTAGLDGYPNARFVSLKEILEEQFIITGPLNSRKGREIERSDKVALTFWWTNTERQVRIQGRAALISDELADKYFADRPVDAQLVALISRQGEEIDDPNHLYALVEQEALTHAKKSILRPKDWGAYAIGPVRIEFMEFEKTRFHKRTLFEHIRGVWHVKHLQP